MMEKLWGVAAVGVFLLWAGNVSRSALPPISLGDVPRIGAFLVGVAPAAARTAPDDFDRTFNAVATSLGRKVRIQFWRCDGAARQDCRCKATDGITINVEGDESARFLRTAYAAVPSEAEPPTSWRDVCDVMMQAFSPGLLDSERVDFMERLARPEKPEDPGTLLIGDTFYMLDKRSLTIGERRRPEAVRASRR